MHLKNSLTIDHLRKPERTRTCKKSKCRGTVAADEGKLFMMYNHNKVSSDPPMGSKPHIHNPRY